MDTVQGLGSVGMSMAQAAAELQSLRGDLETKLLTARRLINLSEWGMVKNKKLNLDANKELKLDDSLVKLKYATYDAEDFLRGFEDQELRQKIEDASRSRAGQVVSSFVNFAKHCLPSSTSKGIQDKLDNIMAEVKDVLSSMRLDSVEPVQCMPTTTEIITAGASQMVGRDTEQVQLMEVLGVTATIDREDLINQVITQIDKLPIGGSTSAGSKGKSKAAAGHNSTHRSPKRRKVDSSGTAGVAEITNSTGNVSVFPIFGIGGMGKTTLAQLIYNDERVKPHFTKSIWVCVSDFFDIKRMTKEIVKTIDANLDLPSDFSDLQAELRKQLKSQKFLLVLDDIWDITKHQPDWESFYATLSDGLPGSMILVTTRLKKIAELVATSKCNLLELKGLPDAAFWEFFKKCAFGRERPESYPRLQEIGKDISKKLCGSPLAAKTLGRLLNSNLTEEHWIRINEIELSDQEQQEGDILPALRLSYLYLPPELRRCFAFCSMFPKDHSFERYEIVDIWVAQGFIAPQGNMCLEDIGIRYFDELRGRCLFQTDPMFPNNHNRYVMHDLIHDTAKHVSMHECFLMKGSRYSGRDEFRHMSVEVGAKSLSTMENIQGLDKLRSLRFGTKLNAEITWFSKLSNILFLSLKGCKLEKLPESICDLRSLRYLDISKSCVKELPAKFWCLYSLQVVDASGSRIKTIHQDVTKLINLRQLALPETASLALSELPGLGNLSCLRTLSYFTVVEQNGGIGELQGMNQLRGTLCIKSIHTVKSQEEAAEARLVDKKGIKELVLKWLVKRSTNPHENEVADGLRPNERIECLKVHGFQGNRLPSWFNPKDLQNLRSLELSSCHCFKTLSIPHFTGCTECDSTGQHASRSTNCRNDISSLAFTHLTSIRISRCNGLENLNQFLSPKNLPSVESIWLKGCDNLQSITHFTGCTQGGSTGQNASSSTSWRNDISSLAFTHLTNIRIEGCNRLKNLDQFLSPMSLPSVESIILEGLESIPADGFVGLVHLRDLRIWFCRSSVGLILPPSLRRLAIVGCGQLDRSFLSCLEKLTSLTVLYLRKCDNVESIPLDSIPCRNKLKFLNLEHCPNLSSIGGSVVPSSIKYLRVEYCPKLTPAKQNVLSTEEKQEIQNFLSIAI